METARKQLRRWETLSSARYLTFSCYGRLPLMRSEAVRDLFAAALTEARQRCAFRLLAWVAMPEHAHLMIVPEDPRWTVPKILVAVKQPMAQRMLRRWRARGVSMHRLTDASGRVRFWQPGGGFDRNVRDYDELCREIGYIHLNPVERGLVSKPTEWAWSSARVYAGQQGMAPVDRLRGCQLRE